MEVIAFVVFLGLLVLVLIGGISKGLDDDREQKAKAANRKAQETALKNAGSGDRAAMSFCQSAERNALV